MSRKELLSSCQGEPDRSDGDDKVGSNTIPLASMRITDKTPGNYSCMVPEFRETNGSMQRE